ncbi:hypothetical protein Plec18170_003894 [Paecilomyces lecythidis]
MHLNSILAFTILSFIPATLAHLDKPLSPAAELQKREFKRHASRSLEKCSTKLMERGIAARAESRRKALINKHKRSLLTVRDTDAVLNKSHLVTGSHITPSTPEEQVFASTADNNTCVLSPEGEIGPYFVPGELVRPDVREGQPGVPVILEGQFIDVETCDPILNLWWDIWNCNATGVYSGVVESGNGNSNDAANINTTFLRGIQKTDQDGVVRFNTIFPGHYSGRTNHHHLVAHLNASVLPNNTLSGGTVAHIGQLFWDQDLVYKVEATYPYNTNNITLTTNAEDHVVIAETEDSTSDPMINYVYLGDRVEDGLFGWITIGVNRSATYDTDYSFIYTGSGGEEVEGSGFSPSGLASGSALPSSTSA